MLEIGGNYGGQITVARLMAAQMHSAHGSRNRSEHDERGQGRSGDAWSQKPFRQQLQHSSEGKRLLPGFLKLAPDMGRKPWRKAGNWPRRPNQHAQPLIALVQFSFVHNSSN